VKKKDDGDEVQKTPVIVGMQTSSSSGVGSELSSVTAGDRQQQKQQPPQRQRKQLTKKSSTLSSTTKTATTATTDGGGVTATVNKYQPKRNLRKKSSSRSSRSSGTSNSSDDSEIMNEEDDEFYSKNLHNHHPVRYPRRSSNPFDEGGGEELDGGPAIIATATTTAPPLSLVHRQQQHHLLRPNDDDDDDEDGLFRRVNRVRDSGNSAGKLKTTDFLDGLIASTTTVKTKGGIIIGGSGGVADTDDGVSVDDQSFLSELLARNNSTRQRGIGTRRGIVENSTVTSGTTLSSHTTLRNSSESDKIDFINIYALDANNTKQQQHHQHRERKQRRTKQHQWRFDIMGVKQQYDIVILKVRQSYVYKRIVEQCFIKDDEGGKCKVILENVRASNMYNKVQRWYNEGGNILPQNRKEVVMFLVCALLLWPLVHVAITIVTGSYVYDNSSGGSGRTRGGRNSGAAYYGSEIQVGSNSRYNSRKNNMSPGLFSMGESMSTWAGSSQVMLSSRSSLPEDFILIPDADWIELQILRSKVASSSSKVKSSDSSAGGNSDGGGFFSSFFRKPTSYDMTPRKPPKRLPLPPILDPVYNTTASIVLFTINCGPLRRDKEIVWRLLQSSVLPRPIDVWPSWSHNSLAQYREDGFTVMYPLRLRGEARIALTKLVNKKVVDRSYLYEYLTWSETTSHPNIGDVSGVKGGGSSGSSVEERAGSVRLVGKDGSAIVIPKLPNGRSDIMIRRTISTTNTDSVLSDPEDEPTVIMRRVMDLPVEDELTIREWEGPSLEEIVWSKEKMLRKGRMPS
jgi:nitrate reductase NapE component